MRGNNGNCLIGRNGIRRKGNGSDSFKQLEGFVRERGARAFLFAFSLTGDTEESKELVQETCFRVLCCWKYYDPERPLEAWVIRILRNAFYDRKKAMESKLLSLDEPLAEDCKYSFADTCQDNSLEILGQLERRETALAVQKAMQMIRQPHRTILAMRALEMRSYADIARAVGAPIGTIGSRLSRAREAIKRHLVRMEVTA